MMKLYDSRLSGNAWKVRLLLRHLGEPFERVTLALADGAHKRDDFARRNRFRRIPVLELADGRTLAESGAILLHLAEGSRLLPHDPVERAAVTAWLFYEQSDLMRFLAYSRFYAMTGQADAQAAVIAHYRALARTAMRPVEEALRETPWLTGDDLSVADFALYPYICLSPEGGFGLAEWPAVGRWITRFEAIAGYEPLVPEHMR